MIDWQSPGFPQGAGYDRAVCEGSLEGNPGGQGGGAGVDDARDGGTEALGWVMNS